jgi:pimeloyl-ACP methyl ester carboxylesterase
MSPFSKSRTRAHLAFLGAALTLATCSPAAPKAAVTEPAPVVAAEPAAIQPSKTGYAEVNGIKFYHEVYGSGAPVVLIHGGLMTIGEMQPWLQPLAKDHQVIAVELQGHGHTADTDRTFRLDTLGDDVAALLDTLQIKQADIVGYSTGADVALQTAFRHPEKARRLVLVSTAYKLDGWYPEVQEGMKQVSGAMADSMMQTPTGQLSKQWPDPKGFAKFLDKMGVQMGEAYDWTASVKKLAMPVQLIFADNDSISTKHQAEFFALLGGGITEPGWQNTKITTNRLAIVPGYSHYNFITSPEVPQIALKFLADPLTGKADGGVAASAASPMEEKKN